MNDPARENHRGPDGMQSAGATIPRRAALKTIGALAAVIPVGGCALYLPTFQPPEELQASMVIGTWRSRHEDDATDIAFRDNGTFDWTDAPGGVFADWPSSKNLDWTARLSYSGEWKVAKSSGTPWEMTVHMSPKFPAGAFGFELFTEGRGKDRRLVIWLGDPDQVDKLVFTRRP
ncbi:hypothetical protein [Paenarthrobacter sp. A20]|uniref:hypothetical protein n=1 Tax=Paenarthrobacter sp. A20 TaxID=2817891 RepID=UPI0020A03B4E|nr:hypothetical protein [Paenarthrobacter sp. A20]MCP1413674.1 hypothetical protein [Paenarthrobacter sp. A20]